MIVSDRDNNRVQVFSQDGVDWLLTIDGTGSGDNCFQHPGGLSLDPQLKEIFMLLLVVQTPSKSSHLKVLMWRCKVSIRSSS